MVDSEGSPARSGISSGISENERIRRFYNRDADTYDADRWTSTAGEYNNRTQLNIVKELLTGVYGSIAEVGSGTGRISQLLVDHADPLTLIDVAPAMLQKACARAPSARPLIGDIRRLPLARDTLDALVCINVLNHVPAFDVALQEIARVVRPGGAVLININNLSSLYAVPGYIVNRRRSSFRASVFSQWIPWSKFLSEMARAGLELQNARGHANLPIGLPKPLCGLFGGLDRAVRRRPRWAPYVFVLAVSAR